MHHQVSNYSNVMNLFSENLREAVFNYKYRPFLCKILWLFSSCTAPVVWPTSLGNFHKNLPANLVTKLLTHSVDDFLLPQID